MILAFVLLGEKITALKAGAMILIGVGTYLMVHKKKENVATTVIPKSNMWLIYAFGAAVFASMTAILGKIGLKGRIKLRDRDPDNCCLDHGLDDCFVTKQKTIKDRPKSWIFLVLSGFATGGSCYAITVRSEWASQCCCAH